jgi:hypothetical protein
MPVPACRKCSLNLTGEEEGETSSFIQNPDQAPDLACLETRQERFVLPGDPSVEQPEP